MTDSKIAQETYRERRCKKRCGTCEHHEWWVAYDEASAGLYCGLNDEDVSENGICKLWKKGKDDG